MTEEANLSAQLREIADHLGSTGYSHGKWIAHARAATEAAASLEQLERERDEARVRSSHFGTEAFNERARAEAAEARVVAMRKAIEPIRERLKDDVLGDSDGVKISVRLGDLRALAALSVPVEGSEQVQKLHELAVPAEESSDQALARDYAELRDTYDRVVVERDEWKERAGFLWTAPDVDMWGKVAESKGVHIREKVNGLLRRAVRAEGQNEALAQVLLDVRAAIVEHAPDTLWVSLIETAVDCIDAVLAATAPAEARSAQPRERRED